MPFGPHACRLGRVAGAAQQLHVAFVQLRAAVLQLHDVVAKETRAAPPAAFATVGPLALDLSHKSPPFRARIKAVSTLGRLLGYAGIQNTDKRLQAAQ